MFCKKAALRNFAKFTRKHMYQSLVRGRCFPENCAKKIKSTFSIEHLRTTASDHGKNKAMTFLFCVIIIDFLFFYRYSFNDGKTRIMYEICSMLTKKAPEQRHWSRSGVYINKFEQISRIVLDFSITNLNK